MFTRVVSRPRLDFARRRVERGARAALGGARRHDRRRRHSWPRQNGATIELSGGARRCRTCRKNRRRIHTDQRADFGTSVPQPF